MQHNGSNPLISLVLKHPLNMFQLRIFTMIAPLISAARTPGTLPVA